MKREKGKWKKTLSYLANALAVHDISKYGIFGEEFSFYQNCQFWPSFTSNDPDL